MSDEISAKVKEEIDKLVNEVLLEHDFAEVDHLGDYTIKIIQAIRLVELNIQHFIANYKEITHNE